MVAEKHVDIVSTLPLAAMRRIFHFLRPRDLCMVERVCVRWRGLPSAEERNRLWWEHVMRETWDEDSVPTTMTRADKKKQWKRDYMLYIAPKLVQQRKSFVKKEVAMLRSRKEKVNLEQDQEEDDDLPEKEWGPPEKDKVTMRAFYKTIRSKPKNKRAKGGMRTHVAEDYYASYDDGDI